jgi:hypothetical protein
MIPPLARRSCAHPVLGLALVRVLVLVPALVIGACANPQRPVRSTAEIESPGPIASGSTDGTEGIELLGSVSIASDAKDMSGLTDVLPDGTPHDQLGAFGSAIAWTGLGERYVAMVDRGPSNGEVAFKCRFHLFDIHVQAGATPPVSVKLVATTLLVNEKGQSFVGDATAYDAKNSFASLRLDPEGVRLSRSGTLFLSDEYGPFVYEFDMHGRRLRALTVPFAFTVPHPGPAKEEKIAGNARGRVTNKGFEGLAISPDGTRLYALLQGPLIQDHGREGLNCRMLELEIASGKTRELCVPLDAHGFGFNELLAIDEHEFLAIERDAERGAKARSKKIVKLDIAGATDVSTIESLPAEGLPNGVQAVKKRLFLDMLDPRLHLAAENFPEKIEGLAFGPDLADGRHVLIVTSDNDFLSDAPDWFWAFAIEGRALVGFRPQVLNAPR